MGSTRAYPVARNLGYLFGLLALYADMHHARFGWAFGTLTMLSLSGLVSAFWLGRRRMAVCTITLDSWAGLRQALEPRVLRVPVASIRWFLTLLTLVAYVYPKYFSPDPAAALERLAYWSFTVAYIEAFLSFMGSIRITTSQDVRSW